MEGGKKVIIGAAAVILLLLFGGVWLISKGNKPPEKTTLAPESAYKRGAAAGNVILVEFGDFQCPSCQMYEMVLRQLLSEYPDNLTFVYRHFPLVQHQNSRAAAEAAEAAGRLGKFWDMHDKLYDTQNDWAASTDAQKIFADLAVAMGLDMDQFLTDMSSAEVKARIDADVADANNLLVTGTPTFYLNGKKIDNPKSIEDFRNLFAGEGVSLPAASPAAAESPTGAAAETGTP